MKTPMQELIDEMQKSPLMFASALTLVEKMRMLEKEKELMYRAYKSHRPITMMDGSNKEVVDGVHMKYKFEQYYNETFNTK